MKKQHIMAFAVMLFAAFALSGCKDKTVADGTDKSQEQDTLQADTTYMSAIENYLIEEMGKQYAGGEYCIPCYSIIAADESNTDDILVWGDYWVFNYNLSGDTLKTVSGGNHPGLMHIRKIDKGYEVDTFDQVADGADNIKSAQRIFGDKFEAFQTVQGDDKQRELDRRASIAAYVSSHNIPATLYQDYGWPAKAINTP